METCVSNMNRHVQNQKGKKAKQVSSAPSLVFRIVFVRVSGHDLYQSLLLGS